MHAIRSTWVSVPSSAERGVMSPKAIGNGLQVAKLIHTLADNPVQGTAVPRGVP
jgi:hypothetical protein